MLIFSKDANSRRTAVFRSTLASPLLAGDTSMAVEIGDGDYLPTLSNGDKFILLVGDDNGGLEVVCTGRNADLLTIEQAEPQLTPGTVLFPFGTLVATVLSPFMLRQFIQREELGTASTHAATDFATAAQGAKADTALQPSGNLAGLSDASTARTNLGLGTAATHATGDFATAAQGTKSDTALQPSGNLADLADAATARGNLGLGTAATHATGDFATAAQGTKADNALPANAGTVTGLRETAVSVSVSSNSIAFDLSSGNIFYVSLTANVTSISFANAPASGVGFSITIEFAQDATGGRTVAGWPSAVKWPGGIAPTITAAANAVDVVSGYTRDGGTTIRLGRAHADSK